MVVPRLLGQLIDNDLVDATGVDWHEGLAAVVVLAVAVGVAALVRRLIARASPNGRSAFYGRLAAWLIIVLGFVYALLLLGFQLGPIGLTLILLGLIMFLSARSLFQNLGAGVVLHSRSPFKPGDLVEIAGRTGTAREITGRTTVIDTLDGRRIHLPNSEVLANPITNLSERGSLRSDITVGVEYGTDLDRCRAVIADAAAGIEDVQTDPPPEVLVYEFDDSSINYRVHFWHEPTEQAQFAVTDEVARAVDRSLRSEGIVIAFPHRVVVQRRSDEV